VNEVKDKLDGLFKKLEHPVLNDITIDAAGWSGLEQFPATITDLYEGEPIVLALKADSLPSQSRVARTDRTRSLVAPDLVQRRPHSWRALGLLGQEKDCGADGRDLQGRR
jgi:hypothetical protein